MVSPTHTKMENLPGHILSDILIWLPMRSVGQMRCVSKPWNAILSQPSFIKSYVKLHRQIPNNDDESFFVISLRSNFHRFSLTPAPFSQSPKSIELPMDTAFVDIRFLGSVNGLICICFLSALYKNIVIKIWNPFISAVSTLPPCDVPGIMHLRFGFDPKTDDYKVVKLMHLYKPPHNKVHLERDNFDVNENGMQISTVSDDDKVCVDGHNGHLHWLGYTWIGYAMKLRTIVAFDLGLETFREISLPEFVVKQDSSYSLTMLDGKLCVIVSCFERYEIWVMNEYGVAESWVKQHLLPNPVTGIKGGMIPVGFTLTNKCVCSFVLDDNLFLYDQVSGEYKSFGVSSWDYVKVVQYVESLDWIG